MNRALITDLTTNAMLNFNVIVIDVDMQIEWRIVSPNSHGYGEKLYMYL